MRTTLTAFVPAHKQTNSEHAPGQQINPVNPLGFVDKTLGDYIRRKDGIDKAFEAVKKECCGNPLRTGPNGRGCENCPTTMKLTFEEGTNNPMNWNWNAPIQYDDLLALWHAAQENM